MTSQLASRSHLQCLTLLILLCLPQACVSVEVHPQQKPDTQIQAAPLLVLVNQGGYDLAAAQDLRAALDSELKELGIASQTLLVTSDMLREQSGIEQARARAQSVLRIMPIAGTRLDGVATRITYDAALHLRESDARVWRARIEVRSGTLSRQLKRRQQRVARKLVAQMREDHAI